MPATQKKVAKKLAKRERTPEEQKAHDKKSSRSPPPLADLSLLILIPHGVLELKPADSPKGSRTGLVFRLTHAVTQQWQHHFQRFPTISS